jgi:hypothetical protein
MACGVAAHVAAVTLPAAELIVALSVLVAGILLVVDHRIPAGWWMGLFVIAGFFHGYAYGESIYGAESTPLAAYLAGLVAVQTVLTVGVAFLTRAVWTLSGMAPRLADHPSPLRVSLEVDATTEREAAPVSGLFHFLVPTCSNNVPIGGKANID